MIDGYVRVSALFDPVRMAAELTRNVDKALDCLHQDADAES